MTMVQYHNGIEVPGIGFGTYKMPPEMTEQAVTEAIRAGYRHIDTAAYYGNEAEVGRAVRGCGILRSEIFVATKVWNTDRGYERTLAAFERSMAQLKLDYLDLYLIHWPANRVSDGDRAREMNAETWRAMEDLYFQGRVRAIGVSNFLVHHLEEVMETARIKPMVNQIEFHPGWVQSEVAAYCKSHDILPEAWSPMARSAALSNGVIAGLAKKYGRTPAQICIRWVMQHGLRPIPKTTHAGRMRENLQVYDFVLSEEDMARMDALENCGGSCHNPDEVDLR